MVVVGLVEGEKGNVQLKQDRGAEEGSILFPPIQFPGVLESVCGDEWNDKSAKGLPTGGGGGAGGKWNRNKRNKTSYSVTRS